MKSVTRIVIVLLLFTVNGLKAQVQPLGISYQAVIRDANGKVLESQDVTLRVGITNSDGSSVYYSEEHTPRTNAFGAISLVLGNGSALSGDFSTIPWSGGELYLNVELKLSGADSFVQFGHQRLQAVPYALFSVGNGVLPGGVQGQTLSHDGSRWVVNGTIMVTDSSVNIVPRAGHDAAKPIFAVLNSNGQVVFAVYETGVRSYVGSESAKGVKGGFAVGGLSGTKGDAPEYFSVTPDSTRVYIGNSTKGVKGGFAVGGLSGTKGTVEYLRITPDSARIYIDNSSTKGVKGGFAVGGLSGTKGTGSNYFTVTQDSTFINNTIFAEGNILLTGNVTTSVGVTDTPLTDIEGNTYKTVKIGTQVWMAENLRTSTYADGTPIGADAMVYNNSLSADTLKNYGMLYSDTAVVSAFNVCPDGWHVPSVTEWEILFINVVGVDWNSNSYELGQKLSEPGLVSESSGFWNYDFNQTNTTGFSARPAGYAYNSAGWYFSGIGEYASFWTFDVYMTQVISIDGYSGSVNTQEVGAPVAYPVRCVKNQ